MESKGIQDVRHKVAILTADTGEGFLKVEKAGISYLTIEHWPGAIDVLTRGSLRLEDDEVRWLLEVLPGVLG